MSATRWFSARWFQVALSLAVVGLIFGFLFPKLADYGEVWDTVRHMTGLEIAGLLAIAAWNLFSYLPVLAAVLPGLRLREAAVVTLASTAISNTLPGGAALGVGVTVTMQRSWGFSPAGIALGAVISGIWNNFVKLGLPIVALGMLAATGEAGAALAVAAVVGLLVLFVCVLVFGLLLRSERLAAKVGTLAQRSLGTLLPLARRPRPTDWSSRATRFREETIGLLRGRSMRITATTLLSHLSLFLVLLLALRHVGVSQAEVSWVKVLAAFAFVRLLSAVPVTPGGLGVVELGLTAAIGSGLADPVQSQVAAAVLVYRALTWFVPIPLGIVSWLFWRSNRSWRRSVADRFEPSEGSADVPVVR
jgi:putative heme transporter